MSKVLNEFLKRILDNNEENFVIKNGGENYMFTSIKVNDFDCSIYYGRRLLNPSNKYEIFYYPSELKIVAIRNKDLFLITDRQFFDVTEKEELPSNLIDIHNYIVKQNNYANEIALPRYLANLPDIEATKEQKENAKKDARRKLFESTPTVELVCEYILFSEAICIFLGNDIDILLNTKFESYRESYIKRKAYMKVYNSYISDPSLLFKDWEIEMMKAINKALSLFGAQTLKIYVCSNNKECILTVKPKTLKWALVTENDLTKSSFVESEERVIKIFKELGLEKYDGISLNSIKKITYAGKTLYEV